MSCAWDGRKRPSIDRGQSHGNAAARSASGRWVIPLLVPILLYFLKNRDAPVGSRIDSDIMTIREVAEYLKLTEKTAYRHAADGKIPGFKLGGAWRFRHSEIDRWIERRFAGQKKRGGK